MQLRQLSFILTFCMSTAVQAQSLPEGEGKQVVADTCGQCHELRFVTDTRRTHGQWQYIVSMMIEMGAPVPEDQVEVVVDYLARNFGQVSEKPAAPSEP